MCTHICLLTVSTFTHRCKNVDTCMQYWVVHVCDDKCPFRFYTLMSLRVPTFLSFFPQLSSLLHILSLARASMQEWEVLLGDRLAPSFQEAELRPWLSGCKNKQKKKRKDNLRREKGQVSFTSGMRTTLFLFALKLPLRVSPLLRPHLQHSSPWRGPKIIHLFIYSPLWFTFVINTISSSVKVLTFYL